jgi:DNA-binding MarR family transcriptional regulator
MENEKVIRGFGILYRTFLSYISKSLSSKDLSFSDSVFLVNIGDKEGISQEEIANSLAIDKAAIARSVKNMENKGYLRTERSTVDKRAKELFLTDSGDELYQFMQCLHQEWIDYVMGDLDPDEIKAFIEIIDHISKQALTYNR